MVVHRQKGQNQSSIRTEGQAESRSGQERSPESGRGQNREDYKKRIEKEYGKNTPVDFT